MKNVTTYCWDYSADKTYENYIRKFGEEFRTLGTTLIPRFPTLLPVHSSPSLCWNNVRRKKRMHTKTEWKTSNFQKLVFMFPNVEKGQPLRKWQLSYQIKHFSPPPPHKITLLIQSNNFKIIWKISSLFKCRKTMDFGCSFTLLSSSVWLWIPEIIIWNRLQNLRKK